MKTIKYTLPLFLTSLFLLYACVQDNFDLRPKAYLAMVDSNVNQDWQPGELWTDLEDGQQYGTMEINGQVWMTRNYNNDLELEASYYGPGETWDFERLLKKNYRIVSNENRVNFGKLFSYQAAVASAPEGWKLPTMNDWSGLFYGLEMNLPYESGQDFNIPAEYYEFNIQSGGKKSSHDEFVNHGKVGYYWCENSDSKNASYVKIPNRLLQSDQGVLSKSNYMSVRYIKK